MLFPPTWINEERVWILRPYQNTNQPELGPIFLKGASWWEYSAMSQLDLIKELIERAKSN